MYLGGNGFYWKAVFHPEAPWAMEVRRAESGVRTFRDGGGLWKQHRVQDVATPEAWERNPELVRRFYDARRLAMRGIVPNAGHEALVRLQATLGADRVLLVTHNIDGLLGQTAAFRRAVTALDLKGLKVLDSESLKDGGAVKVQICHRKSGLLEVQRQDWMKSALEQGIKSNLKGGMKPLRDQSLIH